MKSQLTTPGIVGRPLNFTQIETMKCEILLLLRSLPTQAFNSEAIRRIVCGSDLGKLVEFALALTRLEQQNEITIAILGTQMFIKLASTADEAQGSTSRTDVGGKCERISEGGEPLGGNCERLTYDGLAHASKGNHVVPSQPLRNDAALADFSILHRPHIVRQPEECSACGVLTRSKCECCLPVCDAHRYGTDGHHDRFGMCGKCYDDAVANDRRDRTEYYGSNGRAQ